MLAVGIISGTKNNNFVNEKLISDIFTCMDNI